jgi:hypothetical protein
MGHVSCKVYSWQMLLNVATGTKQCAKVTTEPRVRQIHSLDDDIIVAPRLKLSADTLSVLRLSPSWWLRTDCAAGLAPTAQEFRK